MVVYFDTRKACPLLFKAQPLSCHLVLFVSEVEKEAPNADSNLLLGTYSTVILAIS